MSGDNRFNMNLPENTTNNNSNYNKTAPVDVSSNVWRLFLDSKCSSATVFFRLHLSAHSYFHSPTPWNPVSNSTIPRKVAKLLDSFRPGSSSYSPFQSTTDVNNNLLNIENEDEQTRPEPEFNLLRPSEISQRVGEESISVSSILADLDTSQTSTHIYINPEAHVEPTNQDDNRNNLSETISPEEENRRRLYLNFGRPRPFYRVSSTSEVPENTNQTTISKKKRVVQTLQEEARNKIVAKYGLTTLSRMIKNAEFSSKLPLIIKNFLLTFPCQDFEEVGSDRPNKSASYNVRCNLDGQNYTAIFAMSEVDKTASNLWEDEKDWLKLTDPGVTQILAIAVDPLTENIFYIIPERGIALTEVINSSSDHIDIGNGEIREKLDLVNMIGKSVLDTLERLNKSGLSYGPIREENISLCHGQVLLENPLMVKSSSPCSDLDHLFGLHSSENVGNLHQLGIILAKLLNFDTENAVGHEGCLKLADKLDSLEHSAKELVRGLLTDPQNFIH